MKKFLVVLLLLFTVSLAPAQGKLGKHQKKYGNFEKIAWGISINDITIDDYAKKVNDSTIVFTLNLGDIYEKLSYKIKNNFNETGLYKVTEDIIGSGAKYNPAVMDIAQNRIDYLSKIFNNKVDEDKSFSNNTYGKMKFTEYIWHPKENKSNISNVFVHFKLSESTMTSLTVTLIKQK